MPADGSTRSDSPMDATPQPEYADELPDGCPPVDKIVSAVGTFYAVHRESPPDAEDFRTFAQRWPNKKADPCRSRGNSIMASIEDARHLCDLYSDVYVYVSEGTLAKEHGNMLATPSKAHLSHYTLWRFKGVTMHGIFTKVI